MVTADTNDQSKQGTVALMDLFQFSKMGCKPSIHPSKGYFTPIVPGQNNQMTKAKCQAIMQEWRKHGNILAANSILKRIRTKL